MNIVPIVQLLSYNLRKSPRVIIKPDHPRRHWTVLLSLEKKRYTDEVNVYDFPSLAEYKATPYGVYDITRNEGWVNVGIDHDMAAFAAASIEHWWDKMGRERYPQANHLYITTDGGGSNGGGAIGCGTLSSKTWLIAQA